jgi:hypothetical protein
VTTSTTSSELAHLARALKAPRIRRVAGPLAARARAEGWDYQHYLARVLEEEVLARETSGGQLRVKAARLPAIKTLDDFDFSFQRSVRKQLIAHLAQLDFLLEASNVVFLGPTVIFSRAEVRPVDQQRCVVDGVLDAAWGGYVEGWSGDAGVIELMPSSRAKGADSHRGRSRLTFVMSSTALTRAPSAAGC